MLFACVSVTLVLLGAAPPKSIDTRVAIHLFAAEPDIVTPTGLAVDGRGRVLVIESHTHFRPDGYSGPPADRIRVFEDTDGDGRADHISTFFEGTKWTMGIRLARDGSAYVATRSEIFRLRDTDDDGRADERTTIARLETSGDYPHNGLSGFAFDFEGNVYFGLGENLGVPYTLVGSDGNQLSGGGEGGNVYRCDPEGHDLVRVATGFWNPFHLGFDVYGRLFAVDNDPDSRPPCRLLHVVMGGNYGFQFRNGRKGLHPFTAWNGELPGTLPMVAGTGEAPSGIVSYESDNLPADYRGNLLTTSWGDHRIERFRPQARGASLRAAAEPVIVGGEDFRPVGLAVAPDGSLYATDWVDKSYPVHGKGRIWHIRAAQVPQRQVPASDEAALSHADLSIRRGAAGRLAKTLGGRELLRSMLKSAPDPRARIAAYEALFRHDNTAESLDSALVDKHSEIRALAVRTLPPEIEHVTNALTLAEKDDAPQVRAEALRQLLLPSPQAERLFLMALEGNDPFLTRAAIEGMKRALKVPRLLELARDPNPTHRLGVAIALRETADAKSREAVPALLVDPDPTVRLAAIQWVAEQDLKEYRTEVVEGLGRGATTRALFEAYLAALERLDGTQRRLRDEIGGQDYVAVLLQNSDVAPAIRRRALRVLRPDHPALTIERLQILLGSPDLGLRMEAVRSLRDCSHAGRGALLAELARDEIQPERLRAEAVVGLSGEEPVQRALLIELATRGTPALRHEALRSLRGNALSAGQKATLAAAARGDDEAIALDATLNAPDRDPGAPGTRDLKAWIARLDGPADPEAGERIFFHPKGPGCFRCHQVDGRGGHAGPELSTTAATLDRTRLLESILAPSQEIAPQFVPWLIAKSDGTVLSGLLLEETNEGEQVYADLKGETFRVKTADVVERRPQVVSIMPDNLAHQMTVQEFRDLISYLRSPRGR
jgi:putative membrane-bound dehydrogenase-like protein